MFRENNRLRSPQFFADERFFNHFVNLSSNRNCLLTRRVAPRASSVVSYKKPCPLFSAAKPAYFQRFPATAGN